ncbi:MAG: glycogen/starch/alpha-glucan phosphorylase [Erysipelotrichales bacterium]|nr:glycogen/starch/alpha-glucan phosphorylase [Erysipelotrichales bacterium]
MFSNKEGFKKEYERHMAEEYGRSLELSHITEKYMVLGKMIREYAAIHWKETRTKVAKQGLRQVHYFSMEFLMGRLMTNNLMNLGIYDIVKEGLNDLGIDLNELEDLESDAGLGNGGLGRLAACFMDSLTSLNYPGTGNSIRYQYGFFKQKIENGYQVEVPDQWLKYGNVWEVKKPKLAVDVCFWGRVEMYMDHKGKLKANHIDCERVRAVPYDVPIAGCQNNVTNTLRLWSAEPSETLPNKEFRQYLSEVNEICMNLYPNDTVESGKYLRLKQQYFFVAAGLAALVDAHLRVYPSMDNFWEKNIIQLNDTHPVLVIPELMRILMDQFEYEWDDAWNQVTKCVAYTNHTVLSEALEKWPTEYIQKLLPRIYMIIEEINRRHVLDLRSRGISQEAVSSMMIIKDGLVYMANLAIVASTSVNGVAALHTEILKKDVMKNFYEIYPQKFNNKTNGVTHRRWLLYTNPQLVSLLDNTIGEDYKKYPDRLEDLMAYIDNRDVQEAFLQVKRQRKEILAKYIKDTLNIEVDVDSIFDVQAKRLHAYKRQLLNCMHIIYLYNQFKKDPNFTMPKRTFIFSAKAAPSYYFAKCVIKLINSLSETINNDPVVSKYMKVVFIPNYSVSVAEILLNAADVSEQISTAGKEASGTGNMKFMMNGAITLGTLDGANVEISERVGREYCEIFGMTADEVDALRKSGMYDVWKYYADDRDLQEVLDRLNMTPFTTNVQEFRSIFDELMYHNDEYFLLADFRAYVAAQRRVAERYQDRYGWAKMCLVNIAKSGYFSTDRTITQYAEEIWHLEKVKV